MITLAQFKKFAPNTKYAQQWYDTLFSPQTELGGKSLLDEYQINTPKRIAAFLAQCAHESGGFVFVTENLNYSASGLMRVFPKYFPTLELAKQYERNPKKIASRVYANRMGNGDEASAEGFKFRGRGILQLTGKDNYFWFGASLDLTPEQASEYLETFEGAAQSACWFWETNKLNRFVDGNDFKGLTRAINGGYIGLADREHHYEIALAMLDTGSRLA
jgi:putative chitinase